MEALSLAVSGEKQPGTKDYLKNMAKNMIRKDLEIFRIQDTIYDVFNCTEFYSRNDDEFLSIDHSIQLAYGKSLESLDQILVDVFHECTLALAFDYRSERKDVLSYIERTASFLGEQIFEASKKENAKEATINLLSCFEERFPHLKIRDRASYLNQIACQ